MKLLFILVAIIASSNCDENEEDRDGRGLFDCLYKCPKGKL